MKIEPVIVFFIGEVDKARDRYGCLLREKSDVDIAFAGFEYGGDSQGKVLFVDSFIDS